MNNKKSIMKHWYTKNRIHYFPVDNQPIKIDSNDDQWSYRKTQYSSNEMFLHLLNKCPFKHNHFLNGRRIKVVGIWRLKDMKLKEWEIQEWYFRYPEFPISRNPWIYKVEI